MSEKRNITHPQLAAMLETIFAPARLTWGEQMRLKRERKKEKGHVPEAADKIQTEATGNETALHLPLSEWEIAQGIVTRRPQCIDLHPQARYDIGTTSPHQMALAEHTMNQPFLFSTPSVTVPHRRPQGTGTIAAAIIGGLTAFEIASHTKNPLEGALLGVVVGILASGIFYHRREKPMAFSPA